MISKNTTLKQLALIVSDHLDKNGISTVLVGGAVVSIYTENEYQSYDLDFCSVDSMSKIERALLLLGFIKTIKYFKHPDSEFFLEFPGSTVVLGNEHQRTFELIVENQMKLRLLSPTQSIKDRLAAYYHWKDLQSLDQALMIAKHQKFSLAEIKKWSSKEGEMDKFENFRSLLKKE